MGFIGLFDAATLKSILRVSNYWAKANRNLYPHAITNALNELYDYQPCLCNDRCQCKEFGCTHHYIRKTGIRFEQAKSHFLSCYVDERMRESVSSETNEGRGKKAVEAISFFQERWENLPAPLDTNLLCTEWCNEKWHEIANSFKPEGNSIYKSKWLALLQLDTFVAYDTGSVRLLSREYRHGTFFELMSDIRTDMVNHLRNNDISLPSFREYDNPHEFFPDMPVGHRPIGNIIDKLFLTL